MSRPRGYVPQKCQATNRQGEQCGRWAIRGGAVCHRHGGNAPQVRQAGRERLAALVLPAIARLRQLARQDKDRKVALGAVRDILDRNNLVGKTHVEHSGDVTVTRIERVVVDPREPQA